MSINDTIAAISTGLTNSGISIIRVSGDNAVSIVDRLYKGKRSLREVKSHTINYGNIVYNEDLIDEVLISVFHSPNSFTGEDVVEINCHGGIYVTKKILDILIDCGLRLADPGEFTKRAFLNGRIDLSQAESVMDVINSDNEYALKASINNLRGGIFNKIELMREKILYEASYIESALDDPDNYNLDNYNDRLFSVINSIIDDINKLINDSERGILIKSGICTAIVGKPNVGKSSLLNMLCQTDRSIVTHIPGTTRDIIEEKVNINGIILNIIDTAGIRDSEDVVEKIGIKRSLDAIDNSDLIIYVVDSSVPLDDNDMLIIDKINNRKCICLLNKSDLTSVINKDEIISLINSEIIEISAKEGKGIENIEATIKDMFFNGKLDNNNDCLITSIRHKELLMKALESLKLVINSINDGMTEDLYTIDLMDAYRFLGLIIGKEIEDDLVEEIFSKFCMGK